MAQARAYLRSAKMAASGYFPMKPEDANDNEFMNENQSVAAAAMNDCRVRYDDFASAAEQDEAQEREGSGD